jgi:hypothetical protein
MSQLTLNLPEKLAAELAEASRRDHRSADELALVLVKRGLAVRRFRAARQGVLDSLGDKAPATDEAAYDLLS